MPDLNLPSIIQFVGYPGLFTAVFLESGVFFGFFLPGASMLFTAGLLVSQGIFDIWILIPLLTVAAILGDNTGYWFGAKVGYRLFLRPDSKFFRQEHLKRAKDFYDRHGFLAIVLARFIPIVRTFTPILAGVGTMPYGTFLKFNIIGGVFWGAGVTLLSYFLGAIIPGIDRYLLPIVIGIIVASFLPIAFKFFKGRTKK